MIQTFRIDERLIHGQVITAWLRLLETTHLIVANDEVAVDPQRQAMLKLAVPDNVKCLLKSVDDVIKVLHDPRCQKMKILLIVGNPQDAVRLVKAVPEITEINMANYGSITKPDVPDKVTIGPMVYLDEDDVKATRELIALGKPVFSQKTPGEPKRNITKI